MDYRFYKMNFKEYLIYGAIYLLIASVISVLFYNSFIPIIIFLPAGMLYYRFVRAHLKKRRDNLLSLEFKDFLTSLSSLLSTGYSLENAIVESRKELLSVHGDCLMARELDRMTGQLLIHVAPEAIFKDFSQRTDIDEIKTFSQILSIAKQSGGDLIHIIFSTSSSISSRVNIRIEISTALSGKKFELYIMAMMPVAIMIYINFTQPGFFSPMYHNLIGIIIMTACLIVYAAAVAMAYKILSVEDY